MTKSPTLFDAVTNFMGPLVAKYGRLISDYDSSLPVIIKLGEYEHETTLQALQDLDRAHTAAFKQKWKAQETRAKRKGDLLS